MMQLYSLLQEKHQDVEDQLINDARPLALFSVEKAKEQSLKSSTCTQSSSFYEDPAVNPLQLPKQMLSKHLMTNLILKKTLITSSFWLFKDDLVFTEGGSWRRDWNLRKISDAACIRNV
jgi:hypothetical protein